MFDFMKGFGKLKSRFKRSGSVPHAVKGVGGEVWCSQCLSEWYEGHQNDCNLKS